MVGLFGEVTLSGLNKNLIPERLTPMECRGLFERIFGFVMAASEARFTLAQLKHWDTRLSRELQTLQQDIESSEAMHHMYVKHPS